MQAKLIHVRNPQNKNAPQSNQQWIATLENEQGQRSTLILSDQDVQRLWRTGAPISPFYAKAAGFKPEAFEIEVGPPLYTISVGAGHYTLED